jgi:hypothetical protein
MNRREFIGAAGAAALAAAAEEESLAQDGPKPEFYELRTYKLRRGPAAGRFDTYVRDAWMPAMKRLGIGPIGAFNVMIGPDTPAHYRLIPYKSLDELYTSRQRLAADSEYQKAASDYRALPASDPPYIRVESQLMVAFSGMPKLEPPPQAAERKPRILEIRTYESHSLSAAKKKIDMFNKGEIAIFRKTCLTPVFFGETLIGRQQPNLTYMLAFDDLAARDKTWAAFVSHPEWKALSSIPEYADSAIVTGISNILLRPTSYSEI